MDFSKLLFSFLLSQTLLPLLLAMTAAQNSNLFREYIGAQGRAVEFTDVPIYPNIDFHFILAFAIDYTTSTSPSPTDGQFSSFWDTASLTPSDVTSIKRNHGNVKVALSLGGSSVADTIPATFHPASVDSWVGNAVSSLTTLIKRYNLDGIDINYEHFIIGANQDMFAECIGQLLTTLKRNKVIEFSSIAMYDDEPLQSYYRALWSNYSQLIDYVNFEFYAYPAGTMVSQFLGYYETQRTNYRGGKVLASFISDGSKGLTPANGFFDACKTLQKQGKLPGIFVWSADDSKSNGFQYEKTAQSLLSMSTETPSPSAPNQSSHGYSNAMKHWWPIWSFVALVAAVV
ncbi:chitinase 2-like [Phoenix dactylifera]|uniref:Chitinase 2-like n=1 Tax=Phoenix dactylifera TaxID=42345 RepID=A0A8B7CRF1_PHODC|nr:chitinase 2-like [Phoenix dactylifera]